jgi:hypothetical protein
MEVPSVAMRRLHWPWNQVYWWIVLVWAGSVSACRWNIYHWHWRSSCCEMSLPSHGGDGVAKATWPRHDVDGKSCWRQWCWVMLVTTLSSPAGNGAVKSYWRRHCRVLLMALSSPAGGGAIESCWWRRCRGDMVTTWCRCWVMLTTVLLNHAGDSAVEATWPYCNIVAESCWRWCCQIMLVMALPRRLDHSEIEVRIYDRSRDVPAL